MANNHILTNITTFLAAYMPDHLYLASRIAAIVICSATIRAQSMCRAAVISLHDMGVDPNALSTFQVMAFAARLQLEKFAAIGLTCHSHFRTPHGSGIANYLTAGFTPTTEHDRRAVELFAMVCDLLERHYSPLRSIFTTLLTTGDLGEQPEQQYLTNRPFSPEAIERIGLIGKTNFANVRVCPVITEPIAIYDLKQEVRITEAEAARLHRISPKTLADRRRNGLIPSSLYTQDAENGNVFYITSRWLKYIDGEQACEKPVSRNRRNTK